MRPISLRSAIMLGMKYGLFAIATTIAASPLLGEIQDILWHLAVRQSISDIFPPSWACGLFVAISIFLLAPFLAGGIMISFMYWRSRPDLPNHIPPSNTMEGRKLGSIVGMFVSFIGLSFAELQMRLGMWSIWVTVLVWGAIIFGWIGKRIQVNYQTEE